MLLHNIGKIVWGLAGWAMPSLGLTPYLAAAATVALGLATSFAYFKGAEGKSAAVATAVASCEVRIAEMQAVSAERLTSVLTEIRQHEDEDVGKTARDLCKGSPFCRERKKQ